MMVSCKKATLLMEQASEQKLSGWKKFQLRFHTFMCKNCGWFFKQTEFLGKKAKLMEDHLEVQLSEQDKFSMQEYLNEKRNS